MVLKLKTMARSPRNTYNCWHLFYYAAKCYNDNQCIFLLSFMSNKMALLDVDVH